MIKKSILLLMGIVLLLITYFSINVKPQIKILHFFNYNFGINVIDYWYLRLAYLILFFIFYIYTFKKENGN